MTRDFDYITLDSMQPNLVRVPLILGLLILGSCASATRKHSHEAPLLPGMSAPTQSDPQVNEKTKEPEVDSDSILALETAPVPKAEPKNGVDQAPDEAETDEEDFEAPPTPKKHVIPFEFNQKVADWIQYFSQKDRERFQRFFDRGEPYREVIENILEENQVPADLYYLGMIESGFTTSAKSHAQAVGVWQFMKSTGKLYGLAQDPYIDERRDPIRATEAAAKMLRDLYRDFHSWYLAMAAYNAGPGRIRSAIKRAHTNDFWELVEKKKLPKETMDYVPKFLAARYIGENPELFAFYISEDRKYPNVELVKVPSPIPFASIENTCGIPEGTLSFVNPQYLKTYTHPGRKFDEIWVPEDYKSKVEIKLAALQNQTIQVKPERLIRVSKKGLTVPIYTVKRGDTLKSVAGKRGLSVAYLRRVNGLKSMKITPGQKLKLAASSYHQKRVHPRTHKKKRAKR